MTQEQDIVAPATDEQIANWKPGVAISVASLIATIAALRAERDEMHKEVDILRIDETGYQAVKEYLKARAEAAETRLKELEHYEELWLGIGVKP